MQHWSVWVYTFGTCLFFWFAFIPIWLCEHAYISIFIEVRITLVGFFLIGNSVSFRFWSVCKPNYSVSMVSYVSMVPRYIYSHSLSFCRMKVQSKLVTVVQWLTFNDSSKELTKMYLKDNTHEANAHKWELIDKPQVNHPGIHYIAALKLHLIWRSVAWHHTLFVLTLNVHKCILLSFCPSLGIAIDTIRIVSFRIMRYYWISKCICVFAVHFLVRSVFQRFFRTSCSFIFPLFLNNFF